MLRNMIAGLVVLSACTLNLKTFGNEAEQMRTLPLAQNGKANATIVIAADATRAAQFAAFELRYHLNRITGGDFVIATNGVPAAKGMSILVGDSDAVRALKIKSEAFGPQEYLIRFLPGTLALVGRDKADRGRVVYDYVSNVDAIKTWPDTWDEQGTMYAVYDFLERFCGVRWFNHTEFGTVCPENRNLTVSGLDIQRAPHFSFRYSNCYGGATFANNLSLWLAETDGFKRWDKTAYPAAYASGKTDFSKAGSCELFRRRMREGGEKVVVNHSLYDYYNRFWEQSKDPNLAKIFVAKKTDWFAKGYRGKPPQLCYTSTGLIEQVAQDAEAYFKGESTSIGFPYKFIWGENYFAVEPMDNVSFCKCPKCQELLNRGHSKSKVAPLGEGSDMVDSYFSRGEHSDYFFNFVNEVAKLVKKTNPDKHVITLAYMSHAWPPESLKLEPSVGVTFCFDSNRRPYARGEFENGLHAMKAWADEAKETKRPLNLWLYPNFPLYSAINEKFYCFPGFFSHTIGEQFNLFDRYGFRGMYQNSPGLAGEVDNYVTYKLMDDPTLNVDALLDDYFAGLYGPAAEALKKFYLLVEKTYCDPQNYPKNWNKHQNEDIAWGSLGNADRMSELGKLMVQAQTTVAATGSSTQKINVDLFDKAVWSYMVAGREQWLQKRDEVSPAYSQKLPELWKVMMDPSKTGISNKWFEINCDESLWKEASTLKSLEEQGYNDYKYAWYRINTEVPKEWTEEKIILYLGAVDETCWLWINGRSAGEFIFNPTLDSSSWRMPLRFDITKFIKFGEKNQITLLVQNLDGDGGLWKQSYLLHRPRKWNPDKLKILQAAPLEGQTDFLAINGSFENEGALYKQKELLENGFEFDVDNKWADGWRVKHTGSVGKFRFIQEKAAEGKRYLEVKSIGKTSIYMADAIPADKAYKCSFSAKGEDFEGKSANVSVYAYLYKKDDTFVKTNRLASFTLEKKWELFSFEMPAVADDLNERIAFEFQGSCALDNIKLIKK